MELNIGFPLTAAGSIWRHEGSPSRADAARLAVRVLHEWDGRNVAQNDGGSESTVETSFPLMAAGPRRGFQGLIPWPFWLLRKLTVRFTDTDHAVHVETSGRTGLFLPAIAAILAYSGTRLVSWHPTLIAPAIGFGVAGFYWFLAWLAFDSTTHALVERINAELKSAGA